MIGAIVGDIAGSRFEWCSRLLFAVSLVVLAGCKYEHSVESATASSNEWAAMTNVVESYTVLPGDTVSDIASWNRTTVKRLCELNNKPSDWRLIRPGETIQIETPVELKALSVVDGFYQYSVRTVA